MTRPDSSLTQQLAANSAPYRDPLSRVRWDELGVEGFWIPETAMSLWGLPAFGRLPLEARARLSRAEFSALASVGLCFEEIFMQRASRRLARLGEPAERAYLLHEIREEAGHSLMFLEVIRRAALPGMRLPGPLPLPARWMARLLPEDGPLFWLAVLIAEEVPDRYNRHLRQLSGAGLHPAVREICTLHVIDEARHVAHARRNLEAALPVAGRLRLRAMAPIVDWLFNCAARMVFYPTADIYAAAGLAPGSKWRALALASHPRQRLMAECLAPTRRMLEGYGFRVSLPGEP